MARTKKRAKAKGDPRRKKAAADAKAALKVCKDLELDLGKVQQHLRRIANFSYGGPPYRL